MATLVASASAVSSHASADRTENNVYNDSLSFSNNQVIEKRRVSNSNNTQLLVSSPTHNFPVLGNEADIWENNIRSDQLMLDDNGWLVMSVSLFTSPNK